MVGADKRLVQEMEMKKARFPYTVKVAFAKLDDGRCCSSVSTYAGYMWYRCSYKEKEKIDGVGLCGIHANSLKRWRKYE